MIVVFDGKHGPLAIPNSESAFKFAGLLTCKPFHTYYLANDTCSTASAVGRVIYLHLLTKNELSSGLGTYKLQLCK